MSGGLFVERARLHLGLYIAIEHFLHILADMKGFEGLHFGKTVKEDDALDELEVPKTAPRSASLIERTDEQRRPEVSRTAGKCLRPGGI